MIRICRTKANRKFQEGPLTVAGDIDGVGSLTERESMKGVLQHEWKSLPRALTKERSESVSRSSILHI